jgi:hypothetical protein
MVFFFFLDVKAKRHEKKKKKNFPPYSTCADIRHSLFSICFVPCVKNVLTDSSGVNVVPPPLHSADALSHAFSDGMTLQQPTSPSFHLPSLSVVSLNDTTLAAAPPDTLT